MDTFITCVRYYNGVMSKHFIHVSDQHLLYVPKNNIGNLKNANVCSVGGYHYQILIRVPYNTRGIDNKRYTSIPVHVSQSMKSYSDYNNEIIILKYRDQELRTLCFPERSDAPIEKFASVCDATLV